MSLYNDLNSVLTPYANKIKQNEANVRLALSLEGGGAPTVVSSTSDMTDIEKIYVLSTDGNWYYYDGSTWVSGGTYGAVATDTTLTQPGVPADAEAVGDAIEKLLPAAVKTALYTLLANATYTSPDMNDHIAKIQLWADERGGRDTTAKIVSENKILRHGNSYYEELKQHGGVTKQYTLPNPTTVLYPAGIIPTTGDVIVGSAASLVVYDADGTPVNYVNEDTGNYNRWARDASGTMTEYSQSWTISQYSKIAFSVDMRYLDDAYMYDKTTGKVFFAGRNTPYYGMSNISQAS